MKILPPRRRGLLLGGFFVALTMGVILLSVVQLSSAPISAWIILWVFLALICVPLTLIVIYKLYGLWTAVYRLDRDGFYLTWGLAKEQMPLSDIRAVHASDDVASDLKPSKGIWWPGCVNGRTDVDALGEVEFFATSGNEGLLIIELEGRALAISPPEPETFRQDFFEMIRMGSLEKIPATSQRPNFYYARLWSDLAARNLILVGLVLPLLLLGFLAVRAPSLPSQVPFGFSVSGVPEPLAPPGRLLLLPLISSLCALADLVAGAWVYRRETDRPMAYAIWGSAVIVGGLFWGATLLLLTAT
jgi:hypothetical protein